MSRVSHLQITFIAHSLGQTLAQAIKEVRAAVTADVSAKNPPSAAADARLLCRPGQGSAPSGSVVGGPWLRRGLLSQRGAGLVLIDAQLVVRDANAAAAAATGQPLQAGARLDSLLQARTHESEGGRKRVMMCTLNVRGGKTVELR